MLETLLSLPTEPPNVKDMKLSRAGLEQLVAMSVEAIGAALPQLIAYQADMSGEDYGTATSKFWADEGLEVAHHLTTRRTEGLARVKLARAVALCRGCVCSRCRALSCGCVCSRCRALSRSMLTICA